MNKGKVIRVTTSNSIEIIEIDYSYDELCKLINSNGIELVNTQIIRDFFRDSCLYCNSITMAVDDLGAVKGLPVNAIGSYLYGSHVHGCPIYGDILLFELDPYGEDFPLYYPLKVYGRLNKYFK